MQVPSAFVVEAGHDDKRVVHRHAEQDERQRTVNRREEKACHQSIGGQSGAKQGPSRESIKGQLGGRSNGGPLPIREQRPAVVASDICSVTTQARVTIDLDLTSEAPGLNGRQGNAAPKVNAV